MREVTQAGVSLIESDRAYLPESMARLIEDMSATDIPGGTLRSGGNSSPLEPGINLASYILGMLAVEADGGANQLLAIRSGASLLVHEGWNRVWTAVKTGLTYDVGQRFIDSMVAINGRIIWSNGIDQPLVLDGTTTYGRLCVPLGFDRSPGQPSALYPNSGSDNSTSKAPNSGGYSHVGGIGTVQPTDGEDGALLSGSWRYNVMWEDCFGNLSPASPPATASIVTQSAGYLNPFNGDYLRINKLDSLTRQFVLRGIDAGEEHVAAILVYRSTDTQHTDGQSYLLTRIPGREGFTVADGEPDAALLASDPMPLVVPVQPHRVACAYQGRLVAANFSAAPGTIRWSQPGFPGTFPADQVAITEGGAEVTGLAAWGDYLIVFTDDVIYRLSVAADAPAMLPLYRSVGCAAPGSIQSLADGRLIWLARGGFYALSRDGSLDRISDPISVRAGRINSAFMGRSVSAIDPATGRYLCSVVVGGSFIPTLTLIYDPRVGGWTETTLGGWRATAMCAQPGRARHLLLGGTQSGGGIRVRIWDHSSNVEGGFLTSRYRSNLLRMDDKGLVVFRVRSVIVHYRESCVVDGGSTVFRYWRSPRPEEPYTDISWDACGTDVTATWPYSGATVGADGAMFRESQLCSRKFDLDINSTTGFRFEIISTVSRTLELVGFSFVVESQSNSKLTRVPGPTRK